MNSISAVSAIQRAEHFQAVKDAAWKSRSLAMDPAFILLDEPFAGVDPLAVEDIQSVVLHLKTKESASSSRTTTSAKRYASSTMPHPVGRTHSVARNGC